MKRFNLLDQIRAAQNLKTAFDNNREFAKSDLETLGLQGHIQSRFKK